MNDYSVNIVRVIFLIFPIDIFKFLFMVIVLHSFAQSFMQIMIVILIYIRSSTYTCSSVGVCCVNSVQFKWHLSTTVFKCHQQ